MNTINAIQPADFELSVPPNKDRQSPPIVETKTETPEPEAAKRDPEKLKAVLAENDISLNFHRDEESGRLVVEMIDNVTGDAVRQIPSEVSLRLSEMFSKVQGQLFEARY